jgi:outer membrane protein
MKRICIYLLLLYSFTASAQQMVDTSAHTNVLTIEQAIDLALKNNYDIRLAKNNAAITENDYAYANWAFAPRVSGTANKTWNTTQTKQNFANGTKRDTAGIRAGNFAATASLSWTLFDGLQMFATRQRMEALRDLGILAVKDQVITTVATVIAGYYNVVQQKQQLHNLSEQLSISEERMKLSRGKFETGLGPKTDYLQSNVDYNAQKAAFLRQQTIIEQSKASLNQLMVVDAGNTAYDVQDTIPLNLDLNYGGLRQEAQQTNTGIKVSQQNLLVSQLQLKEAKANYWPTINFNTNYNYTVSNGNAPTNSFNPVYNQNGVVTYGFSATVPIFSGFNIRRQVQDAKLNVDYLQMTLDAQRTRIDLLLVSAFKDYEYYRKAVTLEEENIGLARENAMVALERFKQGVTTVIEVRDAQQSLEDAYNRLITARYNIKLAETQLMRIDGKLVN